MNRFHGQRLGIIALALATLLAPPSATPEAAPVEFLVGGNNTTASIQATVDAFRAALGDPNNANAPGLLTGRREINWDGGGATNNAPGGTPFNVFLNTRGAQFVTPGTGFVQAPASAVAPNDDLGTFFGNATYDTTFGFFSPVRVFTPTGSNVTDAFFFIPGTKGGAPATVSGFGAVFTDVDLTGSTTIQYFDINDTLLLSQSVPPGTVPNQSLSFSGVVFDAGERVARVQIITGNTPLGATANDGAGVDLVVMDDFLYREPEAVLEPSVLFLLASGLGGLGIAGWRRRR